MIIHQNLRVVQRPLNRSKLTVDKVLETVFALRNGAIENCDYGNQLILNEYCDVRIGKSIPGRLQHGWAGDSRYHSDYTNDILTTFLWSEKSVDRARQLGLTNFHAIGAPWLYMIKIIERQGWFSLFQINKTSPTINELWVYGRHSTVTHDGLESELEQFIDLFNASRESSKLLLLSQQDYTKAQKIKELDRNKVITLGSRNCDASSIAHLYRLAQLLSQVKLVITDYPTTLILYASFMECDIKWIRNSNFIYVSKLLQDSGHEMRLFMDQDRPNPRDFREFAMRELGYESLRSPEELRSLFEWSNNRRQSVTMGKSLGNVGSVMRFAWRKLYYNCSGMQQND